MTKAIALKQCTGDYKRSNLFSGTRKKIFSYLMDYHWTVLKWGIVPKKKFLNTTEYSLLQQVWMERKPNKKNLLLTRWENATLPHKVRSWSFNNDLRTCMSNFQDIYLIEYKRINHYDFKFLLKMRNPNRVKKKVIFRLWLIPTNRTSSTARYHPATGFVNIGCVTLWENILVARK